MMNPASMQPQGGIPVARSGNQAPVEGTVRFVQHNLPGLEAGEYRLEVEQQLSTQADKPIRNAYFFAIAGARFAINPTDIAATFPPDQGIGEYDDTLAHIVLKNQTLPWLRNPGDAAVAQAAPVGGYDRDVPSWLAVLLFDEDDIAAYPGFEPQAKTLSLADLFFERPAPSAPQGYSYFFRAAGLGPNSDPAELAKHLDHGQTPNDRCRAIDIPLPLFFKVAPSLQDLQMLAHVRNVDITKKATQNGVPASRNDLSQIPGTSDFAVVLGNRLPKTGKRTFAHLVSLEGMAPFLPIDPAATDSPDEVRAPTQVASPAFSIAADGFIRLASLASWSFVSKGSGRAFETLLLALQPKNQDGNGNADFAMGLPYAPSSSADPAPLREAKNALAMGYVAMNHHTRDGGQTVSWYRGPLLPYPVAAPRGLPTYSSADAATALNPQTGMLDVSYAVAWQLGRLLALQDKQFSVALYKWRRANLRDVVASMETLLARQSLDQLQAQLRDENLIYPLLDVFLPAADGNLPAQGLTRSGALRAATHRTVLSSAEGISEQIKDQLSIPLEIYTWLARLKLLDGVPFRYLVPDERMLPPESIRSFHVDMNWVHALIDGALSIGRHNVRKGRSAEQAHDVAAKAALRLSLDDHSRKLRALSLRVAPQVSNPQPIERVSGFLLRSAAVSGWPGLEVNGYATDGTLMDIVRFERLEPTVMLCLFDKDDKTLKQVDLHEPAEGLHFGVSADAPKAINVRRNVPDGGEGTGHQVQGLLQPVPFRDAAEQRVLRPFRLAKLLDDPKYAQYIQNIAKDYDHLPSSELALQMVKGVGLVSFVLQTGVTA